MVLNQAIGFLVLQRNLRRILEVVAPMRFSSVRRVRICIVAESKERTDLRKTTLVGLIRHSVPRGAVTGLIVARRPPSGNHRPAYGNSRPVSGTAAPLATGRTMSPASPGQEVAYVQLRRPPLAPGDPAVDG